MFEKNKTSFVYSFLYNFCIFNSKQIEMFISLLYSIKWRISLTMM